MSERAKVGIIKPKVFSDAQLRSISVPALLLIGENETLYEPQATIRLAQKRMPKLQATIVPGADHIAAMAQPEDVNARIIEFSR